MEFKNINGDNFDFLIGKSIVKVEEGYVKDEYGEYVDGYILICKDGTIIEVLSNEGCGGCSNGWSSFEDLKKLEENNNVITNIETKYIDDDYGEHDEFIMFVYYEDGTINRLEGDDGYGNGYYGGGFYINIKEPFERVGEND